MDLKQYITTINNFPKEGILFYDLSPLLLYSKAWNEAINKTCELVEEFKPNILAGIESRGFLVASTVAYKMNLGFILIRKKGKLPGEVLSYTYDLEYGEDTLEIKDNLLTSNSKVVILDDVIATGGTLNASANLIKSTGASVEGAVCLIKLSKLKGAQNLNIPLKSLITL